MTSIKLTVAGAEMWASVTGILTSGMVGIPVTIEYDASWDGLRKNLVCRCSPLNSAKGVYRSILNVGGTATVAHEVMQPELYLYLGVEGYSSDGKLVIPTRWAECGKIHRGANSEADISADPTLPVWEQLQTEIEEIKETPYMEEQLAEIQAGVQAAVEAAASAERSKKSASAASTLAGSSANAAEASADSARASMESARASASSAANLANETLRLQRAAEAAAERAEAADASRGAAICIGPDEPTGDNRPMYWLDTSGDMPVVPDAPETVTLTGITASYTGGDVAVGTALDALTGITVTAQYSDGSSVVVTDYSLSGSIVEGSNTITATYQGMTATFTVTGVASGGGELPDISTFVLDVPYLGSNARFGVDVSSTNNPAIVAAGKAADNLPLTDYLSSGYAELYAISFRPNASDAYGGPAGWRAYRYGHLGDNVPVWHEETRIVDLSVSSTSGVDANRLKIHKLVRADILAALDGTEYTAEDIRAICQNVPNVGSKNYNVSVVWMATAPTEEQQQAIISYFEQGGTV